MSHHAFRFHAFFYQWRRLVSGEVIALGLALILVVPPASALKLQQRGLMMQSTLPNVTTKYTLSFEYTSPDPVGSIDLKFCTSPIAFLVTSSDCTIPPGIDVSNAVLADQTGETGFSIADRSANHLVLSRVPTVPLTDSLVTYSFTGIVNPSSTTNAFAIRMETHLSNDGTGPLIDFGSVRGATTKGIVLETQVPPVLIFCVAEQVQDGCKGTNEKYYTDMGELNERSTLTASSQMAVGTNATGGFAITANGDLMSAGTHVLDSPTVPTESKVGTNQFGINLVANSAPNVGGNPEGDFANAVASADYSLPNRYLFRPGDVVAFSPDVSLMKKFTVSYIVNASPTLRAGVYTTTINYIASGRF